MDKPIDFLDIVLIPDCGIVVTFTDGTVASFPPEELISLRPHRVGPLSAVWAAV